MILAEHDGAPESKWQMLFLRLCHWKFNAFKL